MRRSRTTWVLCLLVVGGLLPPGPAAAGVPLATGPDPETLRAVALGRVEAARRAIRSGSLGEALRGGAELAGVQPRVPVPTIVRAPAGTPQPLVGTVADLLGALTTSQASARSARRITLADARAAIAEADGLRRHGPGRREPGARLRALMRGHTSSIDRPQMYGGAIALAEAIDRAMPRLLAATASPQPSGVAACDVLDAAPAVCIGGEGPNVYTEEAWLQIDLGGDDVYRNNAGTGSVLPAASALIDVSGNDLYERTAPHGSPTQGSGLLGIGMLVDIAGDDRYVARHAPNDGAESLLLAQGYAAFGVAVILDGGGNDLFEASDTQPNSRVMIKAQGYAEFGALALILNRGGDDTYLAHGQPAAATGHDGRLNTGGAVVGGQGFALLGGAAIFADDGGSDDATVQALTSAVDHADPRIHMARDATAQGGGYATLGATSMVLWGPGPNRTSVRAISSGSRAGWAQVDGLAMGSFGGLAAVDDAGGTDTYVLEGRSEGIQRLDAETCSCTAAAGASTVTYVAGQATAEGGSVALLNDRGGSDRYISSAATTAEARVHDPRAQGAADLVSADAVAGIAASGAQAAGGLSGLAFLLDTGGDDSYGSTATSAAHASATAVSNATEIVTTSAADEAYSTAQASAAVGGYSELRDHGGADLYRSTNSSSATTEPSSGDGGGFAYSSVQGSSTGGVPPYANETPAAAMLVDQDGGALDRFEATPPDPTCVGTRGVSAWVDCGLGAAGGLNT